MIVGQKLTEPLDVEVLEKSRIFFALGEAGLGLERFFPLERWRVRVGDRVDDRIIWRRGDFVLVVAITRDKEVVLIHEYKQAVERVFVGLPAGTIKKDEKIFQAAMRELRQETGHTGSAGNVLISEPFYNSPDKSTERHFVVIIPDVVYSEPPTPEESETILRTELCEWDETKTKLQIGMHRMAIEVAEDILSLHSLL